jgi:succinylarginine dihydrolase
MKTTVEISDALFERARAAAKQRGTTMRALIEAGLASVLNAPKPKAVRPMRDVSFGGSVKFPADYVLPKSGGREYDVIDGELAKRVYE